MIIFLGILEGNLLESWLPLGAVAAILVALVGGTITASKFMGRQEGKIDTLARDLRENQKGIQNDISALRAEMEHRFERLEDRNQSFVKHRELYTWIEKLREANPTMKIPSPFSSNVQDD